MHTVSINGSQIPARAIAAEMQFHPAPSREEAWRQAAVALSIRALLLHEAEQLGIISDAAEDGEGPEEALIHA